MATTDAILAGKYPAKAHARRVAGYLQERGYDGPGVIYLEAQRTRLIEDNDEAMPFRYNHSTIYYICSVDTDQSCVIIIGNVVSSTIFPDVRCQMHL